MKNGKLSLAIRAVAFLLIFAILFTGLTLVFLPKRDARETETAQLAGFYQEPARTIDVLGLGSCNMYSSFSPVLMYEKYGITGYNMCVPDEEMSTSYYYLKEALKTQDIKLVVVESLFLTVGNSERRERYNRYAFDYLPPSWNKVELALETSRRESEYMRSYDPSTPDTLLTFAGYMFPLLRYHGRNDFTRRDLTYFLKNRLYNFYKGGFPQYTYTTNDGNFFGRVFNGPEINEMSRKYVPKIKALCEQKGIPLIIVKSPNYARWGYDDTQTKIARDYAEELNIPYIDFQKEDRNNFEIYDYGYQTGRLNVYGVKKFSLTLGKYISEELGLQPTALSEKDKAAWDACVEEYYTVAKSKNCNLYPGQIAQLKNLDGALQVRWNRCEDCETYSVYRSDDAVGEFALLASDARGETFDDTDVVPNHGYSYYVVPNEGELAGTASDPSHYVYVSMPKDFSAENDDGTLRLTWEPVEGAARYSLERRLSSAFNFSQFDKTEQTQYTDDQADNGKLYYYRLTAKYEQNGQTYNSMTTVVRDTALAVPEITQVSGEGAVTIEWKKMVNVKRIRVWRRSADEEDFSLIAVVGGSETCFTDPAARSGTEYFYRIEAETANFGVGAVSEASNTVGVKPTE